ncbi:MAG: hypothetical protein IPJ65_42530 [Archangiaceae bacterium]|nr:hypothetical protein [Archangiaceae bacterium]
MATDAQIFEQAQGAYERGRVRWAALGALPLAIVPLASFAVGHRLGSSLVLGGALLVFAALLLWQGRSLSRGLSVGLKAGFVPLVASHAANLYGHICTAEGCTSLCLPACIAAGVVAGAVVALAAARSREPLQVLGAGALVTVLVGGLGCACVGYGGLAGMVLGTFASMSVVRLAVPGHRIPR